MKTMILVEVVGDPAGLRLLQQSLTKNAEDSSFILVINIKAHIKAI